MMMMIREEGKRSEGAVWAELMMVAKRGGRGRGRSKEEKEGMREGRESWGGGVAVLERKRETNRSIKGGEERQMECGNE